MADAAPLPAHRYRHILDPEGTDEKCSICLRGLGAANRSSILEEVNVEAEDRDEVAKSPCSHLFHVDCLRNWSRVNKTCPLCRAPLPPWAD